jgi:hypothetical protein
MYRSPVRLVAHTAEPLHPFSLQTINRTKEKLLAELALGAGEVTIDHIAYAKSDILSLLDALTDETAWKHHCTVYALPALLRFLEEGHYDEPALAKELSTPFNSGFRSFLSPYFAGSFNYVMGTVLREEAATAEIAVDADPVSDPIPTEVDLPTETDRFETAETLLRYRHFILPGDSHAAFECLRIYFTDLSFTLKNLNWESFSPDESILHFVFSPHWIRFVNSLPSSFAGMRDEVVAQLLEIALRFQDKVNWNYLYQLCLQLNSVETSQMNKAEIVRLGNHYAKNVTVENRKAPEKSSDSSKKWLWGIFVGFLIVARGLSTCHEHKNYDFSTSTVTYTTPPDVQMDKVSTFTNRLHSFYVSPDMITLPVAAETGSLPFPFFSVLPPRKTKDRITVENKTGYDCALIYFFNQDYSGENLMPAAFSVYIKSGDTYRFGIESYEGSYCLAFGKQWVSLKTRKEISVGAFTPETDEYGQTKNSLAPVLYLKNYFYSPDNPEQYFLKHRLHINVRDSNDAAHLRTVFTPLQKDLSHKARSIKLTLLPMESSFTVKPSGDLFVQESVD